MDDAIEQDPDRPETWPAPGTSHFIPRVEITVLVGDREIPVEFPDAASRGEIMSAPLVDVLGTVRVKVKALDDPPHTPLLDSGVRSR